MRIEQLTFTRFIAALTIIIFHFARQVPPFDSAFLSDVVLKLSVGVSYFYLLSGFIMIVSYGSFQKLGWIQYMQNRVARVYPVYLLGFLSMIALPLLKNDVNIFKAFFGVTLLQSWIPGYAMSYNFPGWSVSVEFFFYATFPFLINHIYHKFSFKTVLIAALSLFIVSQLLFHYGLHHPFYQGDPSPSHDVLFYGPYMHWSEFILGNVAGLYFIKNKEVLQKNWDIWIVILTLLVGVLLKKVTVINFHNGMLAPVLLPLIVLMAANTGRITRWFENKWAVFLGEISYSMYILQLPVFYYLKPLDLGNVVLTFVVKLLIHIAICSLCFHFVEKPLRTKIKNWKFNFSVS